MPNYTYPLRFFYFIAFCVGLYSCGNREDISDNTVIKEATNLYKIDLAELKYSDTIVKNVEFIPLETSEKCLIANVGKILTTGDKIYILDNKFNQVYLFNNNGQFQKPIGSIGKAPGEYMSADDITFNSDSTSLLVLSNNSKKIVRFTLNGEHIKDMSFDVFGSKMAIDPKNTLYVYIDKNESEGSKNFDVLRLDSIGKIQSKYFKFKQRGDFGVTYAGFLTNGIKGDILFNNAFTDTVYAILPDHVIPKYSFNIPNEKLETKNNKIITEGLAKGKEYNFLSTIFEELPNGVVYSYHSKSMVYTLYENFENGAKFRLSFPLHSIAGKTNNKYLLSTISPLVKENDKTEEFFLDALKNYPGLKVALEKVKPEDNPILVKYTLN